jgi:hypothetical protein
MTDPFDSILSGFDKEEAEKRALQMSAIQSAQEPMQLTDSQAGVTGALGLLPVLLAGLIKGKKGIAAGAAGGLTGLKGYTDDLVRQHEMGVKNDSLLAQTYGKDADRAAQSKDRLITQDAIKQKYPPQGQTVNIYNPGEPMTKEMRDLIQPDIDLYQSFESTLQKVKAVSPELASLRYKDAQGNLDWDKTSKIVLESGKGLVLGTESDKGKIEGYITDAAQQYIKLLSGAAYTDKEFDRLYGIIRGYGLIPQTVPVAVEMLEHIKTRSRTMALNKAASFVDPNTPLEEVENNPLLRGVNNRFDMIDQGIFQRMAAGRRTPQPVTPIVPKSVGTELEALGYKPE